MHRGGVQGLHGGKEKNNPFKIKEIELFFRRIGEIQKEWFEFVAGIDLDKMAVDAAARGEEEDAEEGFPNPCSKNGTSAALPCCSHFGKLLGGGGRLATAMEIMRMSVSAASAK